MYQRSYSGFCLRRERNPRILYTVDRIPSLFYPAEALLPDQSPLEHIAITYLAEDIWRISSSGDAPTFLDMWMCRSKDGKLSGGAATVRLSRPLPAGPPLMEIKRAATVYRFVPVAFDITNDHQAVVDMLVALGAGADFGIAIVTNSCADAASHLRKALASGEVSAGRSSWELIDWLDIAYVLHRLAEARRDERLADWSRFLKRDFRPSRPLYFPGSDLEVTIAEILSIQSDHYVGVPRGIPDLMEGSAAHLLSRRLPLLDGGRYRPGRLVLPIETLRLIVSGQINGRWSGVHWDLVAGSWPRHLAERIVDATTPPYKLVAPSTRSEPWNPVRLQLA